MELQDFRELTDRLQLFHDKKLNDIQRDEWWETFSKVDVRDYKEAIRKAMQECKYLPKLYEMKEFIDQVKAEREKPPEAEHPVYKCDICRGKGYIIFYRNIGEVWYEQMCRCSCKNGDYVFPKGMANFGKLHLQQTEKTKKWYDPAHYSYSDIYGKKEST